MTKGSFEKQMKRLEEIVRLLEDDTTDLDEGIALYEEGLKLTQALHKQLTVFEEKIDSLQKKEETE
ncbi:MAG: exodeoxyribonuclease VII small subunit [Erysipelotrichaceae bacterium]|jgi:exodeoxyribonuclease VII small subunit|nr:exodeoxyribonuclease VII small subunit [Erysipelotrichaceae bacterium]MBQ1787833.1 exodeoxyribonuclease VII small subunit [Erysipelotrichaceae bacterium]MBQ5805092.1 exodeoxyribonuclease VII small subunit [Erysipelotrichaceae bacterium]MBR3167255.1 exodeoxyribonuclease VII small subunit [Erysipelotrichaceae bacterium]